MVRGGPPRPWAATTDIEVSLSCAAIAGHEDERRRLDSGKVEAELRDLFIEIEAASGGELYFVEGAVVGARITAPRPASRGSFRALRLPGEIGSASGRERVGRDV